ncbi:MAG: trigger factor, partial [Cyanobacteria bacterium J149]
DKDVDEERLLKYVKSDLIAEKTLDWLAEKNTIELVPQGTLNKEETEEDSQDN